jgi:hypothetical protein
VALSANPAFGFAPLVPGDRRFSPDTSALPGNADPMPPHRGEGCCAPRRRRVGKGGHSLSFGARRNERRDQIEMPEPPLPTLQVRIQ